MPESTVYLNGDFMPAASARISPEDRGFLLGDGIFDTVRSYSGRWFRLAKHAERFFAGLEEVRIRAPFDAFGFQRVLDELAARNGGGDHVVRITVTRGVGLGGYRIAADTAPTVYASTRPVPDVPALRSAGVRLSLSRVPRPLPFLGVVKTTSLGAMALARILQDSYETVMLDAEGDVAECSASALFAVLDGRLVSPPRVALLPSVTRSVIEERVEVYERRISVGDLRRAEALVVTSTSSGPLPVSSFEEQAYPVDHPVYRRIQEEYDRVVREECGAAGSR